MTVIRDPLDLQNEILPEDVTLPPKIPTDQTALKIVVGDMKIAEESIFSSGMWGQWASADRLFSFRVPQYFWEGTVQPRASLGVPLVYEHTNALLPQALDSLFFDNPPFAAFPRPGVSMDAARANQHILAFQLEETDFRPEMEALVESCLLYGTGIGKWGWLSETKQEPVLVASNPDDIDEVEVEFVEREFTRPLFEYTDIRDVFPDPQLDEPDIRKARYVIHRVYMSISELDGLREIEGYDLPKQETLISYFFPPKELATGSRGTLGTDPVDRLRGISGLPAEFESADPAEETSIDPIHKPLEVLEYWTPDKVITVLQRKLVLRNEINEFGQIPFVSCVFGRVPNSFWGYGVARLVGPEQRLQQGIINARLDLLSLSLNGMFVRIRGANAPTQQVRMRPGGVIDVDRDGGIQLLQPQVDLSNAFAEVAASDQRAERRSGASQFLTQGAIPAAGTSALTKAAGVQALAGGTSARIQRFVERLADLVFIPTLEAFVVMNRLHLKPSVVQHILSAELGEQFNVPPLDVLNAKLEFSLLAGSKLQARSAMAQSLPTIFQFLLQEPVMRALEQQGKKIDFEELVDMIYDVSRWPNKQSLVIQLTPEDEQRIAANNAAVQAATMQQQRGQQAIEQTEARASAAASRDALRAVLKRALEGQEEPQEGATQ